MSPESESELLERIRAIDMTLHGTADEPGMAQKLKELRQHYYGNGLMGDRTRLRIMWRGGSILLFLAGAGMEALVRQIIKMAGGS